MSTDRSRRAGTDDAALDPHALLGVDHTDSPERLRQAYRRALLRAHPDHGGSREQLDAVRVAYEQLLAAGPVATPAPSPEATREGTADGPPIGARRPTAVVAAVATDQAWSAAPTDEVPLPDRHPTGPAHRTVVAIDRYRTAEHAAAVTRPSAPRRRPHRTSRFAEVLNQQLVRHSGRRVRLVGEVSA